MPKFLYSLLPYWIRSVFRSIYFLIVRKPSLKSSEAKRQKPLGDQHARAIEAALDILENVTGKRTGITLPDTPCASNKRIPYLYYINNQKTILIILQGDITRTKVDAIVNAANEHMTGGGGVDGIIHDAAGEQLYEACKAHKQIYQGVRLPTGHSRILLSYDMSNTTYYIINTAGPRYNRYRADDCADELKSCYKTALALAGLYDLESVGFTAISCGIFGYPVDEGAKVALETVDKEAGSVPVVVFVLWDDHIYDAWKRTAAELKFTPIDPNKLQTKESTTTATADENESGVEQSRVTTVSDQPIDESLTQETEQPIAEDLANVISRLPSVPKDEPSTQNMDSQDTEENDFHEAKPLLTTQKTAEMTDLDREKENSTENRGHPSDKVDENPTETKVSTTSVTSKDNSD